ncbi:MAG: glycosyltransferase family 2 protein [Hyphomicrobiales bacterium]|nr:glycosyltransferase family 2 protein [Hyphomicrobiales bacterium]
MRRAVDVWTVPSAAIYGAIVALFVLLVARAFTVAGPTGWAVGAVYIGYDTLLLAFTFWQTLPLRLGPPRNGAGSKAPADLPSLGVIVAAYNEALVLEATVRALLAQTMLPQEIIIADDGSTDTTGEVMLKAFGLAPPVTGGLSAPSALAPGLRWLRLAHGGKAAALNAALACLTTQVMITVDADTRLEPDALEAMRREFGADPHLVAATGVLQPTCGKSLMARSLELFQSYEYMRSFLFRYAWMQQNSLLLVSGAFAGYRRSAVNEVGGFDTDSLVEDYDVMNRLMRHSGDHQLGWRSMALGGALAHTSAPATPLAFMRQRRRWFGGFLQTQYRFRGMVGERRYGRLGLVMLPITAIESLQGLYGLFSLGFLLFYLVTGRWSILLPVGALIIAKTCLDIAFHAWAVIIYRRWTAKASSLSPLVAVLVALIEPYSFQVLRNSASAWGWEFMLSGKVEWGVPDRSHHAAV